MATKQKKGVEPLLPVTLGASGIPYAQGMRAGRWVFATGHMGQDFKTGIPREVTREALPAGGVPKQEKEAEIIFRHLAQVFKKGGTSLANVVRFDQFYASEDAVHPYHLARFKRFPKSIPPSTSVLAPAMLLPDAEIDVQAIAVVPDGKTKIERISNPELYVPATSGFSPGYRVGDFVFPSGAMASAPPRADNRNGLAMAASAPSWSRWSGQPIDLETRYTVADKLKATLELAGASLGNVVKGQAYLRHVEDVAVFHHTWRRIFAASPVPVTIVPLRDPAFAHRTARVEINLIALTDGGATRKELVEADVFTGYDGQPAACRAGDLVFLSGLMAAEKDGLAKAARLDPGQPWFGSPIKAQARCILEKAQAICEAAGASLENVVRIQQFHTDISEFHSVMEVWQEFLPGRPLPFSAIQCADALPVPGATLLMDLWVYAP